MSTKRVTNLYHGTTEERANQILQEGFRLPDPRDDHGVYLTPMIHLARKYAGGRAAQTGSKPAIVHVGAVEGVPSSSTGLYHPREAKAAGADYTDHAAHQMVVMNLHAIKGPLTLFRDKRPESIQEP